MKAVVRIIGTELVDEPAPVAAAVLTLGTDATGVAWRIIGGAA